MNKKENKFFTNPTKEQIDSVCLSYRHDYGLLNKQHQDLLGVEALYWLKAWLKELEYHTQ